MITIGHRRSTYQHSNMAPRLLYLVLFSLYPGLFWKLRDGRNLKYLQFRPERLGAMLEYWYIKQRLSVGDFSMIICAGGKIFFFLHGRHYRYMVLSPFVKTNKTDSWIRISSYNISFPPSFYGVGYEYRMLGEYLPLYYIFLDFK